MKRAIMREPRQFVVDGRIFPIVVDYSQPFWQMRQGMPLTWSCTSIPYEKLKITGEGIREFNCFYVIIGKEGASFEQVVTFCERRKIELARAEHFFAFGKGYSNEYDVKIGRNRIIGGGSTWLDSHKCLDEMLALGWTSFYHAPGRELTVVGNLGTHIGSINEPPFIKGDRFLAVK